MLINTEGKSGTELVDFVTTMMAMSANYQPVIIRALVQADGRCMLARDLAEVVLLHEPGAVDAAHRTLNEVAEKNALKPWHRVLRPHNA